MAILDYYTLNKGYLVQLEFRLSAALNGQ